MLTYESTNDAGEFVLRLRPGVKVDLYVGPKSKQAFAKGVEAGSRDLKLTAKRGL